MTIATDPLYEKPRNENFEVVLIKLTASEFTAKPEDFKRVPVDAADPIQALHTPEANVKGYRVMWATPPGVLTEPEIMARRRELDGSGHSTPGM